MPAARSMVACAAIAAVVLTVAAGLYLLGSPQEERVRRLDERRVQDLRRIDEMTNLYWTRHGRLPASISELAEESGLVVSPRDPATGEPYGYRTLNEKSFELCGVFERDSTDSRAAGPAPGFWSHGAGKRCFNLEVRQVTNR
jgi:hypothetical protein